MRPRGGEVALHQVGSAGSRVVPASGDHPSSLGGLPTKPGLPGLTSTERTPFPTLLASISHIVVVATNTGEPLVTGVDDIIGTHRCEPATDTGRRRAHSDKVVELAEATPLKFSVRRSAWLA